jgi:diguanylate cyclase (GGDEF)-like protein
VLGLLAASLIGGLMLVSQQQLRRQSQLRHQRLHAEKEALDRTAHSDPLTGIWNRRGLERELQRLLGDSELRQDARLAICLIDLDDFKPVNDVYGHAVGDQLLVAVSRRMRGLLREHDVLGRLGGDEFIAVLRGCSDPELAHKLAERIIEALNKPFVFGEMQVRVGASIGIALDGDGSDEPLHDLMRRADQAMYQAKQEGKGSAIVSQA